jgi:hypothetical protein
MVDGYLLCMNAQLALPKGGESLPFAPTGMPTSKARELTGVNGDR